MAILFGISYLIQAVLHGFHCPYLLSKKYRNAACREEYQRGLILPYTLLGIGWTALGLLYPMFKHQNIFLYCLYFILIAIYPYILLVKHLKKFEQSDS